MITLAARIAHDHQPTAHGCTCGKHLVAPKCARGTLAPFIAHVVEVAQEKVATEIEVRMRHHDAAQIGFSAVGDAYANSARIARYGS